MSAIAKFDLADDPNGEFAIAPLPLLHPTLGAPMGDIRGMPKTAGCFAFDPGLGETAICRSAITYVDGDNGILLAATERKIPVMPMS
jgi:hypothetical protein